MKPPTTSKTNAFVLGCGTLLASSALQAADVTWDTAPGTVGAGNGTVEGGAGTWDTTNGNWTVDAGVNNIAWVNGGDLALFTDTGDTVTLGSAITAQGMKFLLGGHTIEGSGNAITLAGNGDDRIGDSPGPSISLDNSGTVTINANIDNAGNLLTIVGDRSGGRNIVVSGVISGSGGLRTYETITATLSGANTYTGQTRVDAATTSGTTLIVSSLNSVSSPPQMTSSSLGVPVDAAAGTIQIGNSGKQANCTLIYNGAGETTDRIINFHHNGSPRTQTIQNDGSGPVIFTSKPTHNGATNGTVRLSGSNGGEFELGIPANINQLRKEGAGTWTLGGTSEYNETFVTNGTLTINGSLSDASATLTGGTMDGSGTLTFNIDGTTTDLIDMNGGDLTATGLTVAVNATGAGLTESEYILVDATGGGTFTGPFAGLTGAPDYELNYDTPNQVKLVSVAGNPFDTWAALGTGVTFEGDANGDGVQDGIAFLLGVADPDDDANGNLPTVTEDGSGNLVMVFDCLATADRGTAILKVAHSNTLASFTAAADPVPDADGADTDGDVSYVVDTVSVAPLNKVTATINSSVSAGGKLFGRLQATE